MKTELAYQSDPLTLNFEAEVIQKSSLATGQYDVILNATYFYPTGGGQLHDTGTLNGVQVVDVFWGEAGTVVHRVEGDISGPVVTGHIDGERRLGHMQHHSGQHMLSAALEQELGWETLSAKISTDTPSTIDVPDVEISRDDLLRVERLVNRVVFENRPIKTYFISDAQIETVPFRRPPKVSGQIRVVEIEKFDYSACGATHCPQTGMIGLIKIVKTERKNKKLRFYFVAGQQALTQFQSYHGIVTDICKQLSTGPEEVTAVVNARLEQLETAEKKLKNLRAELTIFKIEALVSQAKSIAAGRLVTKTYPNRSIGELRELVKQLQTEENLVALLAGFDGEKLSLVVGCGVKTGVSARALLVRHLDQIGGRGGGDDRLAQGGGTATSEQVEQFFAHTQDYI